MTYQYPAPVEINYKTVCWQNQPVRVVRIANEPSRPSAFVGAGELPAEDHNASALDQIMAELLIVLPADGIPAYVLSYQFFPPVPAGLEKFSAYAYEDDTEGWTYIQLKTIFQ